MNGSQDGVALYENMESERIRVRNRVSVIGLDGATFRLIRPWVEAGKLPTLCKLMTQGAWSDLESTIHPLSPQAWASFMTGNNPGKHGIFEFVAHNPNSYDLRYVNGGSVRGKKLWNIMSDAGKRVCVVNVPFTYPPDPVNGVLIAGLDAPGRNSDFCFPSSVYDEITEKFGPYRLREHPYRETPETYLEKIHGQLDYIAEVGKYLKKKEPWDLFMFVFESTDLVQHFYWHYAFPEAFDIPPTSNRALKDAIFNVYARIDEHLEALLKLCDDDEIVIVMSDHGFSPCRKVFFMDRWLSEKGYLTYSEATEGKTYALTRLGHLAFQRYFPNKFKGWLTSLIPGMRDRLRSYLTSATIDWSHTRAFSLGIDSTNIYINSTDRYPKGTVQPGDQSENLKEEIAMRLQSLEDPSTGERIVDRVYRREELYHGECLEKAPDLLVTWKNFEYNTRRGYGKEDGGFLGSSLEYSEVSQYSTLQKSGTHHVNGVFIAGGGPIKRDAALEVARIIDLTPTVLYLLGEKVPDDMDGRVLTEIVDNSFLAEHPIQVDSAALAEKEQDVSDYSEGEEAYIKAKLQGLGYID